MQENLLKARWNTSRLQRTAWSRPRLWTWLVWPSVMHSSPSSTRWVIPWSKDWEACWSLALSPGLSLRCLPSTHRWERQETQSLRKYYEPLKHPSCINTVFVLVCNRKITIFPLNPTVVGKFVFIYNRISCLFVLIVLISGQDYMYINSQMWCSICGIKLREPWLRMRIISVFLNTFFFHFNNFESVGYL